MLYAERLGPEDLLRLWEGVRLSSLGYETMTTECGLYFNVKSHFSLMQASADVEFNSCRVCSKGKVVSMLKREEAEQYNVHSSIVTEPLRLSGEAEAVGGLSLKGM